MESIWTKTCRLPECAPIQQNTAADVAIVGGGLTGLLTARLLKDSGLSVLVLEKDALGRGASAFTTAKITSQHGLIYTRLLKILGTEGARQYAAAAQKAIACYRQLIKSDRIDCDFSNRPAFLYSTLESDTLKQEAESARRLGLPASFTTETELPFPVAGAVRFDNQAQFHPLKFLAGILPGLTVHTHSEVCKIHGHTLSVRTADGTFDVQAKRILLTSHFPTRNVPGFYFLRQHQELSYVLALDHAKPVDGMYFCIDQNGHSLRSWENLLLAGGLGHRTGKLHPGDSYRQLWHTIRQWYPRAAVVAHWSNEDAVPHDGYPFIGPFSVWTPHIYVATGFCKWGMTHAMTAATILANEVLNRHDIQHDVFSPQRLHLRAAAGPFFADAASSVVHLALQKPFAPRAKKRAIEKGYGPTCTHLGCTLSWNPADRTWDCPCHGSRYGEDGQLLRGPACRSLEGMSDPASDR